MIFVFKMIVVIAVGMAPPFIGWLLFNFLSSSSKSHPAYKYFWAVLSGIAMTYTGNFLYTTPQSSDQDTGTLIATAFNKSLPDIIKISIFLIILSIIAMALYWWIGHVRKERTKLLDEANREAAEIRDTATREAETHICQSIVTAAKTIADANSQAEEIISTATVTEQKADEAMQQVEIRRQDLETEYQAKEAELMRKRQSWLDELAGVKTDRDKLKERLANIVRGSIEHWEKEGSEGAAKRRKKQLKKLEEPDDEKTE